MMEEINQAQPHQKIMTMLHRSYSHALYLLKTGLLAEGAQQLIDILHHQYINDSDLENLKYSALLSLSQVQEAQGDSLTALGFLWQALQILQRRSQLSQIGQSNSKQAQQQPEQQFTLVLRMVLIIQKLNFPDQEIYLLKKAIKLSPDLWREKLLLKLRDVYQREGKQQCLSDLVYLMQNKEEQKQVLSQKIERKQSMECAAFVEKEQMYIDKITIPLNLCEKDEVYLKYSCWQTLFTISYVLLKCQSVRNFNRKKYLHKKYDQNNKEWNQFLQGFSLMKTKIEIVLVEQEELTQQKDQKEQKQAMDPQIIEVEAVSKPNWGKMVSDLAGQILKNRYIKKKSKKPLNPLEQLSRLPSLSAKDQKKIVAAQTKSIFTSIAEYYKQIMSKNQFRKQVLNSLRVFNEEAFDALFGEILKDEPEKMKPEGEQNDEEDIQGSMSLGLGVSEGQKDPTKQKKTLKTKKMELIAYQKQLGFFIGTVLHKYCSGSSLIFESVCEMVQQITITLLNKSEQAQKKAAILSNLPIRRIWGKSILKVLQVGSGFFRELGSVQFLDLLLQKLQQLTDKDAKSKQFKDYQEYKKKLLVMTIRQKFMPSTFELQNMLSEDLASQQLKIATHVCFCLVKMHSLYGMCDSVEANFYRDLYVVFKTRQEVRSRKGVCFEEVQKKVAGFIDRQMQKYQKKVALRSSILAMNEQAEDNTNSIDEIYKKDQQISAVLPLLKVFNCHPDQMKIRPNQPPEQVSGRRYLQTFVKLSELFFKKIDLQSRKQFNCRLLTLLSQIIKLRQVITFLYQKFSDGVSFRNHDIEPLTFTHALFYALKFYFLGLDESDSCIKMVFYIANYLLRSQSVEAKYSLVPRMICVFDEIIKFKKNRVESLGSVKRRFYQNLILKNLVYVYSSPLFLSEKKEVDCKRSKKVHHSRSSSQQPEGVMDAGKVVLEEHQQIRERVFDVFHDIYFSTQKQKEFNPKKIEQAVGYFMYLLRAYHQMFEDKVIELQNEALKIFKKCYKLYIEKREDVFQYCEQFKEFIKNFQLVMNGEEGKINKQQFISIVKQEKAICGCCASLRNTHGFYVESLFVLGKFFQAQFVQPELGGSHESWLQDIDKDQAYYLQYLALNLGKEGAWESIIRVNASKTFFYFDSLLNDPFELFRNKFFYTKKIIHFVGEACTSFKGLLAYGSATVEILNILKIKQREYLMIQKEMEMKGMEAKESRELQKKYLEGMKKVLVSTTSQFTSDVRIRYLRLSEIKFKYVWSQLEKETKEEKPSNNTSVIIELDEESNESKIIHPPSKNIEQLSDCLQEARQIIKDLPIQAENDALLHLEEDITMEWYLLFCRHLEWKLQRILENLCNLIKASHPEKIKRVKKTQFWLSDLKYTLQLLSSGDVLSNDPKYKICWQNLDLTESDYANIQLHFSNIFSGKKKLQESVEKCQPQKEPVIVINDEQNEQVLPENNKSRMQEESMGKQSKRSRSKSSSKVAKISKVLILDLGMYIYDRIVQYIIANELFSYPLNNIQAILYSPAFQELILKVNKILNQVCRIAMDLPRYQLKKYRNRRSVVMSLLYCSHLAYSFTKNPGRASELIKDYYSFKTEEFTSINLYNERVAAEKNQLLSDFYNRVIVHNIMKVKFIREVFNIFVAQGNQENLVLLSKKLLKLSKVNEIKNEKEKEKGGKSQLKEPLAIQGEAEGKKLIPQQAALSMMKQAKEAKDQKQKGPKDLQCLTYFVLFCEGVWKFIQIIRKESLLKPVDEKSQKNMVWFRNRIKKLSGDQRNIYYLAIDEFINSYEQRYKKKIKLKKTKKDKEEEENRPKESQRLVNFQFPQFPPLIFQNFQAPIPIESIVIQKKESIKSEKSHKKQAEKEVIKVEKSRRKKIDKLPKEKVPRKRKERLSKEKVSQQGNQLQPIQIKQSPKVEKGKEQQSLHKPSKQKQREPTRRSKREKVSSSLRKNQ